MPGLRGNWCWGNRGSFSIYGEYPEPGIDRDVTLNPSTAYVSTNAYYGHQRLFRSPDSEPTLSDDFGRRKFDSPTDMEVEDEPAAESPITRKRISSEPIPNAFKRIRQGDSKNKEEEDLQFMENYFKQTHGCDYYSHKLNS